MTELTTYPWVHVNEYMNDGYRETVVEMALRHLPQASKELRNLAEQILSRTITVSGFRSFTRIPIPIAKRHVIAEFKRDTRVSEIVICLWAEAAQKYIDAFQMASEAAGISIKSDWSWHEAGEGYFDFENIPELNQFLETYIQEKESPERDHYKLAALWFSRAIIQEHEAVFLQEEAEEHIAVTTVTESIGDKKEAVAVVETETQTTETIQKSIPEGEFMELWNEWQLELLKDHCAKLSDHTEQTRVMIKPFLHRLEVLLADGELSAFKEVQAQIHAALLDWEARQEEMELFCEYMLMRLDREYNRRPDLKVHELIIQKNELQPSGGTWTISQVQGVQDAIELVLEYERTKCNLLEQLDEIRIIIGGLQQALASWKQQPDEYAPERLAIDNVEDYHLDQVENMLHQAEEFMQQLEYQHTQFREMSFNRMRSTIERIKEIVVDYSEIKLDGFGLDDLALKNIDDFQDIDLRRFEAAAIEILNHCIKVGKPGDSLKLASELQSAWQEEIFLNLLQSLANEKKDAEAFLVKIAGTIVHPPDSKMSFPREVVNSLLSGLGQFSSKDMPFELINQIATIFLQDWRAEDDDKWAQVCLILIAAQLSATHKLPDGFLWQISDEWPIAEMPSWNKAWQALLLEEPIQIYTDKRDLALQTELNNYRSEVEKALARDGAHFVRLSSLQSNRHRILLGSHLLPEMVEIFEKLQKIETNLVNCHLGQLPGLLERLKDYQQSTLKNSLNEEAIEEQYKSGIYEQGIDDSEPFHRKISLRILKDCATSIHDFGEALVAYWELKEVRSSGLDAQALQSELSILKSLTPLGQAAFEQICQMQNLSPQSWNENDAESQSRAQIIRELLSQQSYAQRLPNLLCQLVNYEFTWDDVLQAVLLDIAEPVEPNVAAELLLNSSGLNQALLLVQYLPVELQKEAQALRSEQERQIRLLEDELLQLGGSVEGLAQERVVGRWGYLRIILSDAIRTFKDLRENQQRAAEEKSAHFRKNINDLDMALFTAKNEMPQAVFEIVERGLNLARRASGMETMVSEVETFLKEIEYRLAHHSWPAEILAEAIEHLENAMSGSVETRDKALAAEQVLEYMEQNQLEKLGFAQDDVLPSQVNTRIDLLHNWLEIPQMGGVLEQSLTPSETNAIQSMFRYFAQMMSMKRHRGGDGNTMEYTHPIVYEYWELQIPRTAALDNICIYIALPGSPPSSKDIQELFDFIDKKEFLEYFFVFLFAPGCTDKIATRLKMTYAKKGLVLIDEPALLRMLLAEADGNNPLGLLRPAMLEAIETNADVFTVNQSVNARTAIFVGRDNLVEKISASGDNYAIYGGRRIGKSSILKAVEQRLERKGTKVVSYSLEGELTFSDEYVTGQLAKVIGIERDVQEVGDFKLALMRYMETNPELNIAILLDEIDRYIQDNPKRHTLIEALRASSDRFGDRFRVIIAGFMDLYDCLHGHGPYTATSDPWLRMLNDIGPLDNLRPSSAELIVREGFVAILGWKFENRVIPQRIVERTGGHPAFVQYFCLKLLERVRLRGDCLIKLNDIDVVFQDEDPEQSFIAYVRKTLKMNLSDPVSRYLMVWLAVDSSKSQSFSLDQIRTIAELSSTPIPDGLLQRNLELLTVTSVVKERAPQVYHFTVPDYPLILNRLGETAHLESLEEELEQYLKHYDPNI